MKPLTKSTTPENESRLKIAIVSHLYPSERQPSKGPFIQDVFSLLKDNIDVQVFVPTPRSIPLTSRWIFNHSALLDSGFTQRVPYLSIPLRKAPGIVNKTLCHAFDKIIKKDDFDLIHINWSYPDSFLIPLLESKGIPTVLTIHGYLWYEVRYQQNIMKYVWPALEQTQKIFVVGNQLKSDILKQFPLLKDKVHTLFNSVDGNFFTLGSDKIKHREQLGWNANTRHVLTVANIGQEKGIDVLLRSIIDHDDLRKYNFHLIGRVLNDSYLRNLQHIIDTHQLSNVEFHDAVSREELVSYYHASDLFVLPSRHEGFGLSIVEAAATGLPVISTRSGGPEDIINSEIGMLVDVDSPKILASAIAQTMKQTFNPSTIRTNVLQRFDQSIIRDGLISHYLNVLK
ncbi:MAG: glycosyltransferase family 4 protein [Balneolales bacterium]